MHLTDGSGVLNLPLTAPSAWLPEQPASPADIEWSAVCSGKRVDRNQIHDMEAEMSLHHALQPAALADLAENIVPRTADLLCEIAHQRLDVIVEILPTMSAGAEVPAHPLLGGKIADLTHLPAFPGRSAQQPARPLDQYFWHVVTHNGHFDENFGEVMAHRRSSKPVSCT